MTSQTGQQIITTHTYIYIYYIYIIYIYIYIAQSLENTQSDNEIWPGNRM